MPRIRTLSLAVVLLAIILGLSGFLGSGAGAASVQLSWTAPIVNADGTPLTDLAGYRLYYGTVSGQYTVVIDVGDHASASVSGLADEQVYYFSVAAYDTLDNESPFAAEVHAGHWILPPTAGFSTTPTMPWVQPPWLWPLPMRPLAPSLPGSGTLVMAAPAALSTPDTSILWPAPIQSALPSPAPAVQTTRSKWGTLP
jgi:hypothetical protein